jgi:hypothetical protein
MKSTAKILEMLIAEIVIKNSVDIHPDVSWRLATQFDPRKDPFLEDSFRMIDQKLSQADKSIASEVIHENKNGTVRLVHSIDPFFAGPIGCGLVHVTEVRSSPRE